MNKPNRPLFSLSLDTLKAMPDALTVDEHAVLIDNTYSPHITLLTDEWKDYPVQLDTIMVIFCTDGQIDVRVAFEDYKVQENFVCVITPGSIVEIIDVQPTFHCMTLAFTKEFIDMELNTTLQLMQLFKFIQSKPCIQLSGTYAMRYRETFCEMLKTALWSENPLRDKMIQSYIYLLFCCLYPVLSRKEPNASESGRSRIYMQFMELLQANYREYRTVAYYAERMNITPKYLSKVIQAESGQTALRWIENYVLLESKALLRQNNTNVAVVSKKLNFPDQGSFGKFFHRLTGMSPKEYRDGGKR